MQVQHGKQKRKLPLWFPYTSKIELSGSKINFIYKGGKQKIDLKNIHSIMFYGSHCPLCEEFLDKCSLYKIPVVTHRRNMTRGNWIITPYGTNREDILTRQILFRENQKKRLYITRNLLKAKFDSMKWLTEPPMESLYRVMEIKKLISIEAHHAKIYWKKYYSELGQKHDFSRRGNTDNYISQTLNAVSKFTCSIILRWLIYHHLSAFHGFMHLSTEYPALVYDLFEPYRGYCDKIVFDTLKNNKSKPREIIIASAIENIKDFLDTEVYINTTRQIITFHELFHGIVLAFRSYLLGNKRFIVPLPGIPNGGRPIKAGYKLYGRNAGITNFWPDTNKIAQNYRKLFFYNQKSK